MRRHHHILLASLLVMLLTTGCGTTQPVRPLEEGKTDVLMSLGGPVIPLSGMAIPLPYLNVGAAYGLRPNLTLYGNAHITAMAFKNIGLDAGVNTRVLPERGVRPEITVNGRAYLFWDIIRGTTQRIYPMGSLLGSYAVGDRSLVYFGSDILYELHTSGLFLSPLAGYAFPLSTSALLNVETKWLAMNHDTRHGIFEGTASVAGKGNIGFYAGVQWRWE